eukprot:m.335058 g.335058  ORF g.335058 m.335058 type:complete len:215 (-) comp17504_c0_seq1:98-742(-)
MAGAMVIPDYLMHEVQPYSSPAEREKYEDLADIYAILRTLDFLERAFIKDTISSDDYVRECDRLIARFKLAKNRVGSDFDLDSFMEEYGMTCRSAKYRIEKGFNAIVETGGQGEDRASNKPRDASECTQAFITLSDAIELGDNSKDLLLPGLMRILSILNRFNDLSSSFSGKQVISDWISKLSALEAADTLPESDIANLKLDLETQRESFQQSL